MRHSKKLLALLLSTAMLAPSVQMTSIKAQAKYDTSKLSSELLQELTTSSKKEKLPIVVWTVDINQELVEYQTEKATGIDADEFYSESNSEALTTALSGEDNEFTEADFKQYLKETRKERKEQLKETHLFNKTKRAIAKEKYINQNKDFIATNLEQDDITFSSNYAPMIITSATPKQIEKISNKPNTLSIDLYSDTEKEAEDQLSVAKQVINATTFRTQEGLDGSGVTIGLIESGCPNKSNSELTSSDITNLSSNVTNHATMTSGIIVGSNGIAPSAKLISVARTSIYENIEQLLDNNVQLISMSNGSDSGTYGNIPKWIDHVVAQHNVSFIASAGNSGIDGGVCDSGMGYNAISVGAIDDKNTTSLSDDVIASYTSRKSNTATKPEIYAPGSNITVAGSTSSGTSFSCPMVSGMAALLIDAFPLCGRLPSLLKATLIASGRNLNNSGYTNVSSVTSDIGAGVVRATTAYKALSEQNINYGWFLKGHSSWNQTITTKYNGVCRFCLVWIKDNKYEDGNNHSSFTNLINDQFINMDVVIKDKNNRVVASASQPNNTFELCQFTAAANESYTVTISTNSSLTKNLYFSYVILQ